MKFILREIGKLRALKGLIWEVLSKRDRLWLMLTILGQALLSLFDALGILLVGVLFTVTTTNQLQDSVIGKTELYQSLSTFQIQFSNNTGWRWTQVPTGTGSASALGQQRDEESSHGWTTYSQGNAG